MTQSQTIKSVNARLAGELAVDEGRVAAAVQLLDGGATVPFIARYRKEATGSLDDGQLRTLEERLGYLRELDDRRTAVLASIEEQGKRAVGFKLSDGMEVPEELAAAGFKFARQKSKLAGVIRGSFFVIKGEY